MDVTLEFTYFDLEQQPNCTYDYMILYRGTNYSAPSLGENYCGYKSPDKLTVIGPLTIVFHSDYDTEFKGFSSIFKTSGKSFFIFL